MLSPAARHHEWAAAPARYIALDVDGTLVGRDGRVSDEVVAAIGRAQDAGLHVGLATGRMALGVTSVLERTGLRGPHVLHNGAEVLLEDRVLHSWPVPPAALAPVLDACAKADVYVEVYVEHGYLVNRWTEAARSHWAILEREPDGVVEDVTRIEGPVPKLTAMTFPGQDPQVVIDIFTAHGLKAGPAGSPMTPDIVYVNGTHPEADKGNALLAAAAALDIPTEAIVVVGDAGNDLPMLAVAGTAIAMGQAHAEVRDAAHLRAPDVDAHGAATAIDAAIGGWADLPLPTR